jgi:hypothetical protein
MKLLIFSHLLSSSKYIGGAKAFAQLFVANGSKAKAERTLHCHGRDGGAHCMNTGSFAAPSGTFNFDRNRRSAPPEAIHNVNSH